MWTICRVALAVLGAFLLANSSKPAEACGADSDCVVELGTYRVHPPKAWDGRRPLSAALYFHGYRGSSSDTMADEFLLRAFDEIGVLLVAPDGWHKSWAHVGSPATGRDELSFIDSVIDDVSERYPVDLGRLWAVGFSQGGSMVWDLACYRGTKFAGLVAVSGAFWEPLPSSCPTASNLFHIHGLTDPVVPLEGRSIRDSYRQGDVFAGMAVLRDADGCRSNPNAFETEGDLVCRIWSECTSGRQLRMCLHDGGHKFDAAWVLPAWHWIEELTGTGG